MEREFRSFKQGEPQYLEVAACAGASWDQEGSRVVHWSRVGVVVVVVLVRAALRGGCPVLEASGESNQVTN